LIASLGHLPDEVNDSARGLDQYGCLERSKADNEEVGWAE